MKQHLKSVDIETKERLQLVDITPEIKRMIRESKIRSGIANVYTKHTTSAIRIGENEGGLLEDIKGFLERIAPSSEKYQHDDLDNRDCPENERINGHSHLKAFLLGSSESIPVQDNKLLLGQWQSVFYVDLDGENRQRNILIQVMGE